MNNKGNVNFPNNEVLALWGFNPDPDPFEAGAKRREDTVLWSNIQSLGNISRTHKAGQAFRTFRM